MVQLLSLTFFVIVCVGASSAQMPGFMKELMELPNKIMIQIINMNYRIKKHENISSYCKGSLSDMKKGLTDPTNNPWIMKMLDAMGKLPAGVMQVSFSFVGSYDECLSVYASNVSRPFFGQFCTLGLEYENRSSSGGGGYMAGINQAIGSYGYSANPLFSPQWDVCFPSTCTPEEIVIIMNTVSGSLNIPFKFNMKSCDKVHDVELDDAQIVSTVIFSLLGLLLVLGTIIDLALLTIRKLQPTRSIQTEIEQGALSIVVKVLLAFSLYNNAKKMLNTKTSSDNLGAINGIRFLSMTWIILGHTYAFLNFNLIGNLMTVMGYFLNLEFQVVTNGTVSVDVFFFLSGLLLAYVSLKEVKKRGKMNWFHFYFHRFWRLTPAYGLVMLSIFLMPLFGSGPYWKLGWEKTVADCKTNWWTSLLYVNNFVRTQDVCIIHGWYMANDMQFFVVSPLILFFLFSWPIIGLAVNTVFMLVSMVVPAILVMERNYMPTLLATLEFGDPAEYMQNVYIKPYCRMSTYCIGIFIGFMLASKKRFKIHPIVQTILWSLSIAASTAVVYGTYEWNNGNRSSQRVHALFAAANRPAFTLGIAWMTYACCTGYGGIVNRILSWKPFIPLGRMTFMAYLFHPYVMYFLNMGLRERVIVSHYYMVVTFLGFLVISYGVAFATSICFEAPLLNLEKLLLRKPTQNAVHHPPDVEAKVNAEMGIVNGRNEMAIVNGGTENPAFISEKEKY